jgi:hypothetical protein
MRRARIAVLCILFVAAGCERSVRRVTWTETTTPGPLAEPLARRFGVHVIEESIRDSTVLAVTMRDSVFHSLPPELALARAQAIVRAAYADHPGRERFDTVHVELVETHSTPVGSEVTYTLWATLATDTLSTGTARPTQKTERADTSFAFVELRNTCAPWDGPAVTLTLSDHDPAGASPDSPAILVTLYRASGDLSGRAFTVTDQTDRVGSASLCATNTDCTTLPSATVDFARFTAREAPSGVLTARLPDGHILRARFVARRSTESALCG